MPSDPHLFDELKLPFIFVPHGAPEPTEWLANHRDWIKLPATFVPRGRSSRQTGWEVPVHPLAQGSSTDGPAGSPNLERPVPQAQSAMFSETQSMPAGTSPSSDPIEAYRTANDALETAASSYAPDRAGASDAHAYAANDPSESGVPSEPCRIEARPDHIQAVCWGNRNESDL